MDIMLYLNLSKQLTGTKMRYIAITWKDYLSDPEFWQTISTAKNIPLHITNEETK
jgi:hypothetical protein